MAKYISKTGNYLLLPSKSLQIQKILIPSAKYAKHISNTPYVIKIYNKLLKK